MIEEVKVVVLGPVAVGKSSLATRFIFNQFNQNMPTTLGASYFEKIHDYGNGKSMKFQFWDTAGQQKFKALAKIYYKDARAALIMYDVTNRQSFQGMKSWMKQLSDIGPKQMVIAIVGNKIDLLDQTVTVEEGQQFAKSQNAIFKLTSAKEDKGIKQLFDSVATQIENRRFADEKGNTQKLSDNNRSKKKKKKQCC